MKEADSKEIAVRFGEFIRTGRENKKLTQQDMAKALNCSQAYYNYIESGNRNVDLSLAMRICHYLGLDLNDFVNPH